jgi:hypothetical protein
MFIFAAQEKLSSVKLKENRVDRALIEESVHLETIRLLKEKCEFPVLKQNFILFIFV